MSSRKLVSISAAAAELGVSDRTVRRYIAAGRLKGYRVGQRMIRVDLAQLDLAVVPIGAQR
ncbi:MAG: helix-turn-helix domain-containing protein [Rhodococcus sp.]|nr:helix-turn-helix domain-containing protein [Rhodococcus sp. (in: high G+C Gram-positive bacteria)]MBJ7324838.1 helix-turn-helix domain-containing protein [Rhodococcus sp. (in: high G+C Gram-positive bacteria)]